MTAKSLSDPDPLSDHERSMETGKQCKHILHRGHEFTAGDIAQGVVVSWACSGLRRGGSPMSFTRQLASVVAVAVFLSAQADIINVDVNCPGPGDGSELNPYCSIQTAIDNAAMEGDEIVVAPGNYLEAIHFLGKAIIKDPKSSHPKVVAAQELLRARVEGYDKIGRIPKAADSINRIMDRTDGKPVQRVVVAQVDSRDPEQLRVELMDLIEQFPEVRKGLESLGIEKLLPEGLGEAVEATGIIDTDADVIELPADSAGRVS